MFINHCTIPWIPSLNKVYYYYLFIFTYFYFVINRIFFLIFCLISQLNCLWSPVANAIIAVVFLRERVRYQDVFGEFHT